MVSYGIVWYRMVWYGTVRYDTSNKEVPVRRSPAPAPTRVVQVGQPSTFFGTGLPTESFGFCFSQDALCHAGRQTPRALEEAARLLAPGGVFACTNILRAEEATEEELDEVLVRLQVYIYCVCECIYHLDHVHHRFRTLHADLHGVAWVSC